VTGWTIDELPAKLRAAIDGDYENSDHDLMRMAADEIELLRAKVEDLQTRFDLHRTREAPAAPAEPVEPLKMQEAPTTRRWWGLFGRSGGGC
jgi:hypothetical protein